jgi:hypothetical protein
MTGSEQLDTISMDSTNYYLLSVATLLFIVALWPPATKMETKADKFRRLEEICIMDYHGKTAFRVPVSPI